MEVLRLGWEKEISYGLRYDKVGTDGLFHVVRDLEEVVGMAFVDPVQAESFYGGVRTCLVQLQECEKQFQINIQPPDIDTLQHISGIKRKLGEEDYEIVNHLSELVDPNIRKMFSLPFKSDKEAQLCVANIRSQTRKHSSKTIDLDPLCCIIRKGGGAERAKNSKMMFAMAISSPDINSFMHVQSSSLKGNIDNINALPREARKMFTPEYKDN